MPRLLVILEAQSMHLVLHRLSVPVCVFTQDFKTSSPVLSGMLRDHAMAPYFEENDHSSKSAISILGSMFLNFFFGYFPEGTDNATVGQFFIRRFIAVHVDDFLSKHDVLVLMARKLCCFARNECRAPFKRVCDRKAGRVAHSSRITCAAGSPH
mmetsp:Transcript_6260/g.21362  ORF Transcript_6260/g.21362 Transcript_6260/m.21362 type:complete len:154 (-) Transcript_6260:2708-3169(-)